MYLPTHLCERLHYWSGISCLMSCFFLRKFSIACNGLLCFLFRLGCYQFHSDITSCSACSVMNECICFLTITVLIHIVGGSSLLLPPTQDCCKDYSFQTYINYLDLQEKGAIKSKAT